MSIEQYFFNWLRLAIIVYLSAGMIGNYNGVVEDDVKFRNGTVVTENVDDRLIHEVGQSCEFM